MNICTPGNCICDAREWEGDTNCMGEIECPTCGSEHKPVGRCTRDLLVYSTTTKPNGDVMRQNNTFIQGDDGQWRKATPNNTPGVTNSRTFRLETWLRRHGFRRTSTLMQWWDERKLGR